MNIKVTALPCLCADVYEKTKKIYPGGEALNFAVHASEFTGIDVTLLGIVGNDEYGKKILDSVNYRRMDVSNIRVDKKKSTAYNMTYLTPEGDRYYKDDSWHGDILEGLKLNRAEKRELMISDAVFINYYSSCFDEVYALKKDYGFKLAVDFDIERDFDKIDELADNIDFVLISGTEELLPKFKELSLKHDGLFNMTLAEKGSVTYKNGNEYRVEAIAPDEYVDSTGCGDSYHAAFVCGILKGDDILKTMKHASELASLTLEHMGGF